MTIRKDGVDVFDAIHVITNMRDVDRKEIYALRPFTDGPYEVLTNLRYFIARGHALTWCADDGVPVALSGYVEQWPGVANIWAFGTDRWPEVVLGMTRHIKRVMVPQLVRENIHRAECQSLLERRDSEKWLPFLGLHLEAVLAEFGRQREDFGLYVWRADYVHGRQPEQQHHGASH